MGAFTNNRKRRDDYYKSLSPPIDQSYGNIAKKPKLSIFTNQNQNQNTVEHHRPASSDSVVARISQYPERKSGFGREVHAPVRNSRFGKFSSSAKNTETTASSEESPSDKMGRFSFHFLLWKFKKAKDAAVGSLRYMPHGKQKGKEVIEIDSEDDKQDNVSDDSGVEEAEIVEDYSGSKSRGGRRGVEKLHEPNVRTVEKELRSFDSSVVTDVSGIAKVDDEEKNGLMQFDQVEVDSGVPYYKRLLDGSKRRDIRLASLSFDIEVNHKRRRWFDLIRPQEKEENIKKDVAEECFVPLTEEEAKKVNSALSNSNRRKVLVTHQSSNIDIVGEKLQCLKPRAWLNDEVINLYFELLKEREKREPQKFLKCHFFNTFFFKKLISGKGGYNFQSVRRWTSQRKLGYSLLECDKIFVPIHKEVHWCLAVINKRDGKFQYLDSLKGVDTQVTSVLARYFVDEIKDKCGKCIDVDSWEHEAVMNLPEQENGFDCGMFMIKYADFYSRDIGLCFSQEHMPYFRLRTANEILKLRAE